MARYYTDHAPLAEALDIPKDRLNVVNQRLAAAGCDYRVEASPGDIDFDLIRREYGDAAEETCNLIKHALAATRPELEVID